MMPKADPNYIHRVRWRRDTWVAPRRWNVRYFATGTGAQTFAARLLTPRPGDALPVRVRVEQAGRGPWETILEDERTGDELFGDPSWRIDRW